jgi:hypothetical protein
MCNGGIFVFFYLHIHHPFMQHSMHFYGTEQYRIVEVRTGRRVTAVCEWILFFLNFLGQNFG